MFIVCCKTVFYINQPLSNRGRRSKPTNQYGFRLTCNGFI
jgi:hypothetical protein